MSKEKISTKDRILEVALNMFSTRGYSAVSIRDISGSIGIKESSIYYHFLNKQAIFDALLNRIRQISANMRDEFNLKLQPVNQIDSASFISAAILYMTEFLLSDAVFKTIHMLFIEKHSNPEALTAYYELLYDIPLAHHESVYITLIKKNILKDTDVKAMAMEYQSLILFVFFKNFPCNEYSETDKQRAIDELNVLMKRFYNRYFIEGGN